MNWEEEVDKVAGVKTPTEESIFTKPKTGIDKKFLTVEEGGTMRTDIPVFVDRSQLAGLPPLDSKGKTKVAEAKNEVDWMLAVDKAIKSQSAPKEKSYDWEKTLDKGLEIFNTIPSTIKGINEAVNAYTGGIAGAAVGGTYSIGKSLLEYVGKAIGDNIASKMAGNKNYKPQEVDWEANKTEGERLGQKVAKIPFGIFSSGEPETPLGKALTTPPPMTGGVGLKQLAESLDPRRLISAPAEIAKEAVDLVNESWGVPKDSFLRHADTTISEFASYILGAKVYKGLRDTVAARFHKNAWDDLTPDQKQIVALDLEDLISRGYSEGEVLRRWGSPELFAQALSRRNRGEGVEAPKRSPIVPAQEAPSTAPERAITFPPERAFKPPTSDRAITMGDRRPVAVSEPFSPGETPEPYTHKSDEVAPTGSAQVQPVPDSPAKFMVREELKKKLVDGSIKFPPRMEKTVEATTTAEGDVDETAWMDLVDEAAGIKKEVEIPAVFKTMHIDDLKKFASDKVVGARAEIAKRKAAGTTEPIIESEMSKTDVLAGENISGKTEKVTTKTISPSNYLPTDNLFNKPDLKRNSTYAWRSMGESEFNKLMSGEKEYLGDKQASKGNFLAGIPESAGQFGGKGKFLVEFGGVKIAGDEGLVKGSKATVDNVTKVWKYNDRIKSWEEFKVTKNKPSEGTSGSFSTVNPVFSKATPSKELSTKSKSKKVTLTPEQEKALVKKMQKALGRKGKTNDIIEKETIAAGANLRTLKERLLKDMLGGDPLRTIVGELVQNALDATKFNNGTIAIESIGNELVVKDTGTGMTPDVAMNNLVILGEQGTKGAEDMGGFGLAKLPIMGYPDEFDIVTIADAPDGNRYKSHIWSTKDKYMSDHEVNFKSEEVDSDPQTGLYTEDTGTTVILSHEDFDHHYVVKQTITDFTRTLRTPQEITFIDSAMRRRGEAPLSFKGQPLEEAHSKYVPIELSLPSGSDILIKFVDRKPVGWGEGPYEITTRVYNKGLLLPDIPRYSSLKFQLSRKPDFSIEIDFQKTPPASDTKNYPFLVNRTRLSNESEGAIKDAVKDRIRDIEAKITSASRESLKEVFDNAPTVGETKIIIPFKDEDIRIGVAAEINKYPDAFDKLGKLFNVYSKILTTIPDTKPHAFAITTNKKLHGFRPQSGILDQDYIVVNPFSYLKKFGKTYADMFPNDLRKAATAMVDTLIHESAHINESGHYADFVHEFHRINEEIGHKKLLKLEKEAQDVFTVYGEDIERATETINRLQSSGEIADVFSDYTPESNSRRVKEEGSGVYDRRAEKIGRELEDRTESALQAMESKAEPEKKGAFLDILKNESGAVAVYTPPGFYSKLQEVVEVKMSGKMEMDQLKKMLKNNGVSDAEIDATLSGLEGKVTKQQVMEEIAINGVEFKDVVLGMTDKKYQDILNAEVSRANKFLQAQDTDIRKRASEIAAGDPHDLIAFASHVSNNSSYMPVGKYKVSEDFINIEDTELPTHYEQYSEPGYIPGSYREMFVTAPKTRDMILPKPTDTAEKYMQDFAEFARRNNISYDEPFDFIDRSVLSEEDLLLLNSLEDRYYALEESGGFDLGGTPIVGGWNDGHGAYANVKNPIVRIRFDERKIDNKKVLFVEEMQGPSTFNQEKMPDSLKKRIYDIGVKKILSYAKENGFDSVAWTTGDMQADRYNLSKYIDSVRITKFPSGTYHIGASKNGTPMIVEDSVDQSKLEDYIGKELSTKVISSLGSKNTGQLQFDGVDLKVGGEGLKQLYDKVLPSLFKKYGKNELEKTTISKVPKGGRDTYRLDELPYDMMKLIADYNDEFIRREALDDELARNGWQMIDTNTFKYLFDEKHPNKAPVLSTPITSKTPSSFTMYSGINVFETLDVLKGLKENIEEGIPYIEELGRKAYENGKRTWEDWSREIKRVLGDLYDKFEDFMRAIYHTAERIWKDERGYIEVDINGEKHVKPRVIKRSELSKQKKLISRHEKIRDKILEELDDLENYGGKKSFERLKAIRMEKLEKKLAEKKQERAKVRLEQWSKAFETLKQKEYASHVAKLKTQVNRINKTIERLKEAAAKEKDIHDVVAPAPKVEDVEFMIQMKDLNRGFVLTQNPIYTMENIGRQLSVGAVNKVKDLFYYPFREADHYAAQHFANIHKEIEERRKSLPSNATKNLMLNALAKTESGWEILKNMGYKEGDIPKLSPKEAEVLKWGHEFLEYMYGELNKARRKSGIPEFGHVDNYITFARDLSMADILGFGIDSKSLPDFIHRRGTEFAYAKHRVGGIKKAKLDFFNVLDMYAQTATKHIYLSPEISMARELLRKFDVERTNPDGTKYEATWDASKEIPNAYRVLTNYLDFISGDIRHLFKDAPQVDKILTALSTNVTIATLSGNIRSAGIQLTALLQTITEIGPYYTSVGVKSLPTDWYYIAKQKSYALFNREFDITVKLAMSGAAGVIGKARETINKSWIGLKGLKALDDLTATATWIGAYRKAIEVDKLPEDLAVKYADDIMVKTQASASRHDLAPIQRSALGKFLTTFQTFVINNWNWLVKEVLGINNVEITSKTMIKKLTRYIITTILINILFEDLLNVNSPLPAPINAAMDAYTKAEEKNKKARSEETKVNPYSRAAWSAGLEFLQLVPGLGNARFGSSFLGAPAEFLDVVSGKMVADAGGYTGYQPSWLEIAGKGAGVPGTTQISKSIRYFNKKEKEEEKERKGGGKLKGLEGFNKELKGWE